MTTTIAVLVVLSACMHPLWNLLLKGDTDRFATWLLFGLQLSIIGAVYCLVMGYDVLSIQRVWPWLLMSWAGQMIYGTALVRIYEKGDLSAYYPIVRASPVGVAIISFLFLGVSYGPVLVAGIALTVFGAFWLQKQPGRRLLDDPRTLGLAVLSMTGSAIYSIADSRAVTQVEPAVMFFWCETLLTLSYLVVFRLLGQRGLAVRAYVLMRAVPLRQVAVGIFGFTSYFLILVAYSQGGDVAAVTTVRQLSIPVSVILGGMLLKESLLLRRLGASLLLAAGIVLVVIGG